MQNALVPMRAPAHQVLVLAAILKAGLAGADRNASVSQRLRYDLLGNLDPKVPPTTFDMIGTLALITGSMNQMQSGVNFVDFKGKMTKVQLDRMEVKVDALPTRDEYLELKATVDALKATVDALPTSAQFKALKATVDDLPTSAEFKALKAQVKGEHQALRAQVADLPTRRELFALVIALVIVFGLFFWGIQKRWSDETKLRARFMPPFVNDRCSSPASRSCNRRHPPYPGSAPADLWQKSRTRAW